MTKLSPRSEALADAVNSRKQFLRRDRTIKGTRWTKAGITITASLTALTKVIE